MKLILIPFFTMLLTAWFSRKNLLWNDKPIPKGVIIIFIILSLIPIVNIIAVLIAWALLLFNSFDTDDPKYIRVKFKDTKLTRFLKS